MGPTFVGSNFVGSSFAGSSFVGPTFVGRRVMQLLLERWVFGYGSLIWNPEVDFECAELARLYGFHRRFCIGSTRYRGTPQTPGVVLGLDRGGSCIGMAFRLSQASLAESVRRLYDREMGNEVYIPTRVSILLASGERTSALAFVANRSSPAYQRLADAEVMRRLAHCSGQRGANAEYLIRTVHSLKNHGVRDAMLERLARQLTGAQTGSGTQPPYSGSTPSATSTRETML
jgi:glutathione-specific gamma-glutamylcyclotransferase